MNFIRNRTLKTISSLCMDILGARQWNKDERCIYDPVENLRWDFFAEKAAFFAKSTVDVRLSSKYTSAKQAKAGTLLKGDRSGSQCLPIRCDMTRHRYDKAYHTFSEKVKTRCDIIVFLLKSFNSSFLKHHSCW